MPYIFVNFSLLLRVFAVDLSQKKGYSRTIQMHTEADDGYGRDPRRAGAEGA